MDKNSLKAVSSYTCICGPHLGALKSSQSVPACRDRVPHMEVPMVCPPCGPFGLHSPKLTAENIHLTKPNAPTEGIINRPRYSNRQKTKAGMVWQVSVLSPNT